MKHDDKRYKGNGGGRVFAAVMLWIFALALTPLSAQTQAQTKPKAQTQTPKTKTKTQTPNALPPLPAELADFTAVGAPWSNRDSYEPALDNYGIPEKAYVYGVFNGTVPAAIRGYNKVDNTAGLKPGQWAVVKPSNYEYVVIFLLPEEFTTYINDSTINIKVWNGWASYQAEAVAPWNSSNMGVAGSWANHLNPLDNDVLIVGFQKTGATPAQPAEISAYGGAPLSRGSASSASALAADDGIGRWIYVTTTANTLFIIIRLTPEMPAELTNVEIWAPVDLEFAARKTINLEVGTSVNLTAVLTATGVIKSDDRDVIWSFDSSSPFAQAALFKPTAFPKKLLPQKTTAGTNLLKVTAKAVGAFNVTATSEYKLLAEGGNNTSRITINIVPVKGFDAVPTINVVGAISGWKDGAISPPPPAAGITYLGFTADAHNGLNSFSASTRSIYRNWMDNLQTILRGGKLEYMSFLGDNGSAYQSGAAFWDSVSELMGWADGYKASGFVGENIFVFGNHEWYTSAGGNYRDDELKKHPAAQRYSAAGEGIVVKPNYILYPFGPVEYADPSVEYGSPMIFELPEIKKLGAYLATAPKNIPIFIMAHFPIHTTLTEPPFRVEDRVCEHAELLIETLNKYPNVIFLWGHNHSSVDPMYDKVFKPGDLLPVGHGDLGESKRINFFYASAGTMSDREYRPDLGPYQIAGKGLLAAIKGAEVKFIWYTRPVEPPKPEFKLPSGLESLVKASGGNMKIWYDYYNYRLDAPASRTTWNSGWVSNALIRAPYTDLMPHGAALVLIGFRGSAALATADEIAALAIKGYAPRITAEDLPDGMVSGAWTVVSDPNRTMVFVILRTVSDGNIWLPAIINGGVKVLNVSEPDPQKPNNANSGWITVDGTGFKWKDLIDVLTASGTVTLLLNGNPVSDTAIPYRGDSGYSLKIGDAYYGVRTSSKTP